MKSEQTTTVTQLAKEAKAAKARYDVSRADAIETMRSYETVEDLFNAIESGMIPHVTFNA